MLVYGLLSQNIGMSLLVKDHLNSSTGIEGEPIKLCL
jgi:hypothetical protein